jgi:hypothetical protein
MVRDPGGQCGLGKVNCAPRQQAEKVERPVQPGLWACIQVHNPSVASTAQEARGDQEMQQTDR